MSENEVIDYESWFDVLNWISLPNFGSVLTIENDERFVKNYLKTSELQKFEKNIFMTLTGGFEQQNIRLMGRPGCGKTSFLHSLKKNSDDSAKELLSRYVFYIFKANRAVNGDSDTLEDIVISYILEALKNLYVACYQADIYYKIEQQKISKKYKLNKLIDFYKAKKKEFDKILIFIIDDADLIDDLELQNMVRSVLRNLNVSHVKKWLVIRESTYKGYSLHTKRMVDAFFSDRRSFPEISLYEIIQHRISKQAGQDYPKNPFSEELCNVVLERLFDGNLRESLSILKNILSYVSPGNFKSSTDERVIQKYINQNSISAFLSLGVLPNLYDFKYRSSFLPVIIDLLLSNRHIKQEEILFGAVNYATETRVERANLVGAEKTIKLRKDDFDFAVQKLIDLGLMEKDGKLLVQLPKGALLCDYVSRKHYRDLCERLLDQIDSSDAFWGLIRITLHHRDISLTMISWDKPMV